MIQKNSKNYTGLAKKKRKKKSPTKNDKNNKITNNKSNMKTENIKLKPDLKC